MLCFSCGKETGITGFVGRGDVCPHCRSDARVCRNCEFFDPKSYNECREPQAERVVEKDRSNFCDFFKAGTGAPGGIKKPDPRAAANALFKKG